MSVQSGHPVRLSFRNALPLHTLRGSLLRSLVEEAAGTRSVVVQDDHEADLVLVSDRFTVPKRALRSGRFLARRVVEELGMTRLDSRLSRSPHAAPDGVPAIWFTQENERPPAGQWCGYLSFDLDPLGGRNAYFPSWWWLVDLLGASAVDHFLGRSLNLAELTSPRTPQREGRTGFVCAFINNPTPTRMHAIRALQEVGQVDVYGRAVGRPVSSKMDVARWYRYVLCFENDVYPGYVTEKVFEAWATGAVPLWWGQDPAGYLNPSAIVNAATPATFANMVDTVAQLESSPSEWDAIVARPLLTREPDLTAAIEVVRRALR